MVSFQPSTPRASRTLKAATSALRGIGCCFRGARASAPKSEMNSALRPFNTFSAARMLGSWQPASARTRRQA
eukprot:398887-Pleurochrysis_carterae.AAC.2